MQRATRHLSSSRAPFILESVAIGVGIEGWKIRVGVQIPSCNMDVAASVAARKRPQVLGVTLGRLLGETDKAFQSPIAGGW